ncbi:M50 family metallopeptidase [Micromonospora sp. CPCC 206061]|uniref:M50 family metallopeptidase n=1 Tax=Micromonospora sp. CPCC 206061 TaxID=3122410 RepID=UPI002FF4355E
MINARRYGACRGRGLEDDVDGGAAVLGAGGAALVCQQVRRVRGQAEAVLWASLGFLVVMLIAVRGLVGWLVVPALMVVIGLAAAKVDAPLQTLYAHMWVWFLLIGAVQRMLLYVRHKHYYQDGSDTRILERRTLVANEVWVLVLLAGTIAALAYGGAMLLRTEV